MNTLLVLSTLFQCTQATLLNVRCQSPENCLQLNIPGGFSSPFWKNMGYKYNTTEHPECSYVKCDMSVYPSEGSIIHDVSGYAGVDLIKYQKPPTLQMNADFVSVAGSTNSTTYTCTVCGHVYNAANDGAGVPFEKLPDSWTCPVCGSPKSAYKPTTLADGTVVWSHPDDDDHHDGVSIPTVKLSNGVEMPAVAAGTWQYGDNTAQAAVEAAIKAGFTHIDTAHDYCGDGTTGDCKTQSNQRGINLGIKSSGIDRSKLFITTKVPGCGLQGISRDKCGEDSVAAALDNLVELGVDYVDLLLVHFPPPLGCGALNCGIIQSQWKALSESVLKTNKTRALGVSNFCVSCFKCLLGDSGSTKEGVVVPVLNQVQYHIGMGADPEGLMSYCKSQNIVVEAYSPLGDNTTELINGELTKSIGNVHNKSGVQVALKWIWQHGHPLTTKSSNPIHLAEDIDLFDWELSDSEMSQLDAATKPSGKPSFMCSK